MSEILIEAGALSRIWSQLNAAYHRGRHDGMRTAHIPILEQGWGYRHDIQDVLWETDDRADLLSRHNDDFDFLLQPFGLHFESLYRGPFSSANKVFGHSALRSTDAAAFIMEIERLGFSVDAEPLVQALRPGLLRRKYLTSGELSVVWHEKQQHRSNPLFLRVQTPTPDRYRTIKTASGYFATALLAGEIPVMLRVDAPKKRLSVRPEVWAEAQIRRFDVDYRG